MPILFRHTIRKDDRDYRVEFSFDDEAIMNNSAGFEIKAGTKNPASDMWTDITLHGEVRLAEELLVLSHEGREIARVSLNLPLHDLADAAGFDIDIDHSDMIDRAIGSLGLEGIIQLIPTDPFLGCIIKGAASTAIGQVIRCWHPNRNTRPFTDLARRIGSCLRDHATRMLFTFIYRAGRCAAFGGAR